MVLYEGPSKVMPSWQRNVTTACSVVRVPSSHPFGRMPGEPQLISATEAVPLDYFTHFSRGDAGGLTICSWTLILRQKLSRETGQNSHTNVRLKSPVQCYTAVCIEVEGGSTSTRDLRVPMPKRGHTLGRRRRRRRRKS